jgi:hypothetical protein
MMKKSVLVKNIDFTESKGIQKSLGVCVCPGNEMRQRSLCLIAAGFVEKCYICISSINHS